MSRVRVLVVEDSLTVRRRIVEVLRSDPEVEVVGEATDGKAAIELCQALRPDAITLDMMLPVMSGLAATEYIMAYCPTPILIVSASLNRGEVFRTCEALAAGALDVLDKPRGDEAADAWETALIRAVKMVARIKVITHPRARLRGRGRTVTPPPLPATLESATPAAARPPARAIAIGASTGGPGAVVEVLRALPADFPLPVLVTIHIGGAFASALTEWLDDQCALRVVGARDGEPLPVVGDGRVFMASADRHLVVAGGRLRLVDGPERHSCRPSVDVLFESLAREAGAGGVAVLLTGMGRDGADGMLAVQRAGGQTIAQDEASSVVFGMPREAIALGAAQRVLALERIGPALREIGAVR
jgi:two-component system chemotaxis response regulator CheB